jgi:hypothetical protein
VPYDTFSGWGMGQRITNKTVEKKKTNRQDAKRGREKMREGKRREEEKN